MTLNKQVVKTYLERVWNRREIEALDEAFAPNVKARSALATYNSLDELREATHHWFERVGEMKFEILHLIGEGNLVMCHWRATVPGGVYKGAALYRVENEKIQEYWEFIDNMR